LEIANGRRLNTQKILIAVMSVTESSVCACKRGVGNPLRLSDHSEGVAGQHERKGGCRE